MWSRASGILAMVLVFSVTALSAPDLPPAPEGFSWKRIEEMKATFLIPAGWHFKYEASGGTLACFLTAEEIREGGQFETGLSINVFKNRSDKPAVALASEFAAEMAKKHEVLEQWQMEADAFQLFGLITRQVGEKDDPTIVVSYLSIGNDRTNTLYLLWFESPESTWEVSWQKGKRMLQEFTLDNEF